MAAAFANIFMAKIEMQILDNCAPLEMLLDDIISLLHTNWYVVNQFIEQVIKHHPTITFMAEISVSEVTFLDTAIYRVKDSTGSQFSTWEPTSSQQGHSTYQ